MVGDSSCSNDCCNSLFSCVNICQSFWTSIPRLSRLSSWIRFFRCDLDRTLTPNPTQLCERAFQFRLVRIAEKTYTNLESVAHKVRKMAKWQINQSWHWEIWSKNGENSNEKWWDLAKACLTLSFLFVVVRMVHWRWRIVRLFVLETHGCWQHFLGCCRQIAGEMCYSKKTKKVGKQRVQTCGQVDSGQFHFSFWDTWLTWLLSKLERKASFRTCPWDTAIRGLLWLISAVQNWTLTTTIHRLWVLVYHGLSLFSVVYHHLSSFSRFKLPYLSGWQGAEGLQMTKIFPGGYLCLLPGSKSSSSFRLWGLPRCHCS